MLQDVRQLVVPVAAHAHPPRHQALPLRDLPPQVHPALPPPAAHPHAHGRQALQVPLPQLQQGLLAALQPAVALALPPDGQALQVQLVLQVLHRGGGPSRAHTQAQGVQAPEDAHLPVLRQVLHPGDLPRQAHAEARGQDGQARRRHDELAGARWGGRRASRGHAAIPARGALAEGHPREGGREHGRDGRGPPGPPWGRGPQLVGGGHGGRLAARTDGHELTVPPHGPQPAPTAGQPAPGRAAGEPHEQQQQLRRRPPQQQQQQRPHVL